MKSKVGVRSVVAVQSFGEFSVGAVKWFAQACCGEIINPNNDADETTDPIKIRDNRKEVTKFFRDETPLRVEPLILDKPPWNIYFFTVK
ncbi:MAG TPA: hypothetical protein VD694_02735 [Nitrososphaeraceae archaeon]|nr:hypothetical protein [Nitrososphaeraceae archaeon]